MKPTIGKYYYINYVDKQQPEGSYAGIARCVARYERDEWGNNLKEVFYEFEHPQDEQMVRSLYTDNEILMEAK
jgi:hypothetical protein